MLGNWTGSPTCRKRKTWTLEGAGRGGMTVPQQRNAADDAEPMSCRWEPKLRQAEILGRKTEAANSEGF